MRALVLFYAYDGDSETVDPIAIVSEVVWENIGDDEVIEAFEKARAEYDAPQAHCRAAWVDVPHAGHLFGTPELGTVEFAGETTP